MFDNFWQQLTTHTALRTLLEIVLYFLLAEIVRRFSGRIAGRLIRLRRFTRSYYPLRLERQKTLKGLVANAVSFFAYLLAILVTLSIFVSTESLLWVFGLFSAAFGLGARPIISDYITGISFIFDDPFDVGEKVEILGMEGVVEQVRLDTTHLRAPTGELLIIPNGEVRLVRNFSRGLFSLAKIRLKIEAGHLAESLVALERLSKEALQLLPNLLEPWQVINETGHLGQHIELSLIAKAKFGKAADLRPRLLAFLQEHFTNMEVLLVD